jgi:hypothetical protein
MRTFPSFSGKTDIQILEKVLSDVQFKRKRLNFISLSLDDPILDVDTSLLDSTLMTMAKSILITNVSLETTQHLCVLKNGNLPTPSTQAEFLLLNDLLLKLDSPLQVVDVILEGSALLNEKTKTIYNKNPAFIAALELVTSIPIQSPKSIATFMTSEITSIMAYQRPSDPLKVGVSNYMSVPDRTRVMTQLCLIPRSLSQVSFPNDYSLRLSILNILKLSEHLENLIQTFLSQIKLTLTYYP